MKQTKKEIAPPVDGLYCPWCGATLETDELEDCSQHLALCDDGETPYYEWGYRPSGESVTYAYHCERNCGYQFTTESVREHTLDMLFGYIKEMMKIPVLPDEAAPEIQ